VTLLLLLLSKRIHIGVKQTGKRVQLPLQPTRITWVCYAIILNLSDFHWKIPKTAFIPYLFSFRTDLRTPGRYAAFLDPPLHELQANDQQELQY
jgi:hypothetical protein